QLVSEVLVEALLRDACPRGDVCHGREAVALVGDSDRHAMDQALALRGFDELSRQPAVPAGQPGGRGREDRLVRLCCPCRCGHRLHDRDRNGYGSARKRQGFQNRIQVSECGRVVSMSKTSAVRRLRGVAVLVGLGCVAGASAQVAQAETFVVNSTADLPVAKLGEHVCITRADTCTLRAAVMEANIDGGRNKIVLPAGHYRLTIPPSTEAGFAGPSDASSGDLAIEAGTLTIVGAGARHTIVDGNHLDRIFSIGNTATVTIRDTTLTGGDSTGRGTSKEIDMGGAIYNTGTLTLDRVAVVGNHADGGGGIFSVPGSYITINQSLIAHNSAYEAGGIRFDGGGELIDSTVTDNRLEPLPKKSYAHDPKLAVTLANELSGYGGGIDFPGGNNLDIVNSTITDNHAIKGGGGLNSAQSYAAATSATSPGITLLLNTIVANNTS